MLPFPAQKALLSTRLRMKWILAHKLEKLIRKEVSLFFGKCFELV